MTGRGGGRKETEGKRRGEPEEGFKQERLDANVGNHGCVTAWQYLLIDGHFFLCHCVDQNTRHGSEYRAQTCARVHSIVINEHLEALSPPSFE